VGKEMKHRKIYRWAIIILGTLTPIFSTNCDTSNEFTYKTFTLTEGIAHYSFEYRTYYKINGVPSIENSFSAASLKGPIVNKVKSYTQIVIQVWVPDQRYPNAESVLAGDMKNRSPAIESDILDQSNLLIGGVPAKQLVFSERDIGLPFLGILEKYYNVDRRIYFDHKGLVWRIYITSDSSTAEADKADFDYILQTFKFFP
jgi:hypothetical protein